MSTIALYRKWRPQTFSEVVGQTHIVQSLKNSIIEQHIAHAYLFCGTRGTGKTSLAKIFAKTINCVHPQNGDPCGTCDICKDIQNGTSMDIIEMDAASNNSVDHIRKITEEVYFLPAKTTYKVYIIDEFHMLTGSAFNALLKTLEEPPAHVVFILATTETHRIPATILSRCQRYNFHRIPVHFIKEQLIHISKAEQIQIDDSGLEEIAYLSDGALRDAISLLDQCQLAQNNELITQSTVQQLTGRTDKTELGNICIALITGNVNYLLDLLQTYVQQGKHIHQLIDHLLSYTRDIMIVNQISDPTQFVYLNENECTQMKELANQLSVSQLILITNQLIELKKEVKWAENKKTVLELYLLKLMQQLHEKQMLQQINPNHAAVNPMKTVTPTVEKKTLPPPSTSIINQTEKTKEPTAEKQSTVATIITETTNTMADASKHSENTIKSAIRIQENTAHPDDQTTETTVDQTGVPQIEIDPDTTTEAAQTSMPPLEDTKQKKAAPVTNKSSLWLHTLDYLKETNPFIYCILLNTTVSGTTEHIELAFLHMDESNYTFLCERKNENIVKDALKKANNGTSIKLTIHITDKNSTEPNELDWINDLKEKAKIIGLSIEEKGE